MQLRIHDLFEVNGELHTVRSVKQSQKTGQVFIIDELGNRHSETDCKPFFSGFDPSLAEQPLNEQELQTNLLIVEAIIESGDPTDLELLGTMNDVQKKQLADCLTVDQKRVLTALKRANQAAQIS